MPVKNKIIVRTHIPFCITYLYTLTPLSGVHTGGRGFNPPQDQKKSCDIIDAFLILNHPCIHKHTL